MQMPNPETMHSQWGEIKKSMGAFISRYESFIEKYENDGTGPYDMGFYDGFKAATKEMAKKCGDCESRDIIQTYHLDNPDNRCLFDNYSKLNPGDKNIVKSIVEALTAKYQIAEELTEKYQVADDCTKPHF